MLWIAHHADAPVGHEPAMGDAVEQELLQRFWEEYASYRSPGVILLVDGFRADPQGPMCAPLLLALPVRVEEDPGWEPRSDGFDVTARYAAMPLDPAMAWSDDGGGSPARCWVDGPTRSVDGQESAGTILLRIGPTDECVNRSDLSVSCKASIGAEQVRWFLTERLGAEYAAMVTTGPVQGSPSALHDEDGSSISVRFGSVALAPATWQMERECALGTVLDDAVGWELSQVSPEGVVDLVLHREASLVRLLEYAVEHHAIQAWPAELVSPRATE